MRSCNLGRNERKLKARPKQDKFCCLAGRQIGRKQHISFSTAPWLLRRIQLTELLPTNFSISPRPVGVLQGLFAVVWLERSSSVGTWSSRAFLRGSPLRIRGFFPTERRPTSRYIANAKRSAIYFKIYGYYFYQTGFSSLRREQEN